MAKKDTTNNKIKNAYALFEVLVRGGNPNGDPDQEGRPRMDTYQYGIISGAAIKRQIRDMIGDKSPVFTDLLSELKLDIENYSIYVRPDVNITDLCKMEPSAFLGGHWDARVFGSTLLNNEDGTNEAGAKIKIKPKTSPSRGVIQVEDAISLQPIVIEDRTGTRKGGVEAGKDKGMRNRAVVAHGFYRGVIVISDTRGNSSQATQADIDVFLRLLTNLYSQNSEASRGCRLESVFLFEPNKPITISTFERNVGHKVKDGVDQPTSIEDYELRDSSALKDLGTLTRLV